MEHCDRSREVASIEVNFSRDWFPAHVTRLQRMRADRACAVTAQEGHVPPPLHANAAAVRLFDLGDLGFEVTQSFC